MVHVSFTRTFLDLCVFISSCDQNYCFSVPRSCDNSRFLRKEVIQEYETALELERRRFAEFHIAPKALARPLYFGHSTDQFNPSEGLKCTFAPLFITPLLSFRPSFYAALTNSFFPPIFDDAL